MIIAAFVLWAAGLALYALRCHATALTVSLPFDVAVTLLANYFFTFALPVVIVMIGNGDTRVPDDARRARVRSLHSTFTWSALLSVVACLVLCYTSLLTVRAWSVLFVLPTILSYFLGTLFLVGRVRPAALILLIILGLIIYGKAVNVNDQSRVIHNSTPLRSR